MEATQVEIGDSIGETETQVTTPTLTSFDSSSTFKTSVTSSPLSTMSEGSAPLPTPLTSASSIISVDVKPFTEIDEEELHKEVLNLREENKRLKELIESSWDTSGKSDKNKPGEGNGDDSNVSNDKPSPSLLPHFLLLQSKHSALQVSHSDLLHSHNLLNEEITSLRPLTSQVDSLKKELEDSQAYVSNLRKSLEEAGRKVRSLQGEDKRMSVSSFGGHRRGLSNGSITSERESIRVFSLGAVSAAMKENGSGNTASSSSTGATSPESRRSSLLGNSKRLSLNLGLVGAKEEEKESGLLPLMLGSPTNAKIPTGMLGTSPRSGPTLPISMASSANRLDETSTPLSISPGTTPNRPPRSQRRNPSQTGAIGAKDNSSGMLAVEGGSFGALSFSNSSSSSLASSNMDDSTSGHPKDKPLPTQPDSAPPFSSLEPAIEDPEIASLKETIRRLQHRLEETEEARHASETCLRVLREFLRDNPNAGGKRKVGIIIEEDEELDAEVSNRENGEQEIENINLPPLPTETHGHEGEELERKDSTSSNASKWSLPSLGNMIKVGAIRTRSESVSTVVTAAPNSSSSVVSPSASNSTTATPVIGSAVTPTTSSAAGFLASLVGMKTPSPNVTGTSLSAPFEDASTVDATNAKRSGSFSFASLGRWSRTNSASSVQQPSEDLAASVNFADDVVQKRAFNPLYTESGDAIKGDGLGITESTKEISQIDKGKEREVVDEEAEKEREEEEIKQAIESIPKLDVGTSA